MAQALSSIFGKPASSTSSSKYKVNDDHDGAKPLLAADPLPEGHDEKSIKTTPITPPVNRDMITVVKAQDNQRNMQELKENKEVKGAQALQSAPVVSEEAKAMVQTLSTKHAQVFAKMEDREYLEVQLSAWLKTRSRGSNEKIEVSVTEALIGRGCSFKVTVNGKEGFRAEQVYSSNARELKVSISGSKDSKSSKKTFLGPDGKVTAFKEGTSTYANGVATSFNGKATCLGPDGKVTQVEEGTWTYVNGDLTSFNGKVTYLGPDGKVTQVREGTWTYVNGDLTSFNGTTTFPGPDGKVARVEEGTSTYANGVQTSFTPKATAA